MQWWAPRKGAPPVCWGGRRQRGSGVRRVLARLEVAVCMYKVVGPKKPGVAGSLAAPCHACIKCCHREAVCDALPHTPGRALLRCVLLCHAPFGPSVARPFEALQGRAHPLAAWAHSEQQISMCFCLAASAPDVAGRGREMAQLLQKQIGDVAHGAGGSAAVEPVVDAGSVASSEQGIRKSLFSAAARFDETSSAADTAEEKHIKSSLRAAMQSPSVLGQPRLITVARSGAACEPDFAKCPVGWSGGVSQCTAGGDYTGPCASQLDLAGMGSEQKLAVARFCGVQFPCSQ